MRNHQDAQRTKGAQQKPAEVVHRARSHPAIDQYARAVDSGKIVAGRLIKLALERHYRDLAQARAKRWKFDRARAAKALDFFSLLVFPKTKPANQPVQIMPWWGFALATLYGWLAYQPHGREWTRRFHRVYLSTARKNSKTGFLSACLLKGATHDGEEAAECFSAATKFDQAALALHHAKAVVRKTPGLRRLVEPYKDRLVCCGDSFVAAISADYHRLDGWNPHVFGIDEYHAHPTSGVVEVLETGTANRPNWLEIVTTTAGQGGRGSPCELLDHHAVAVLEQRVDDDELLALVYRQDTLDEWRDTKRPELWEKSNPSLGVTVSIDRLVQRVELAKRRPDLEPGIRQKEFNEWVGASAGAISSERWRACPERRPDLAAELEGQDCWAGMDLSSSQDLSSIVLLFEGYWLLVFTWVPAERAKHRALHDRVPYDLWAREGYLEECNGRTIDQRRIRTVLTGKPERVAGERPLAERYRIREIAYDPKFASGLVHDLADDGLELVECPQSFKNLTLPTQKLLDLVEAEQLGHNHHPVLTWQSGNAALHREGASGGLMLHKGKSKDKIDGLAALVMALWRFELREPPKPPPAKSIVWANG